MERDRRIDHREQPIERMLDVLEAREHQLGVRLVRLVEHGLEHRPEIGEVEVQRGPFDPECLGELAHAGLHAPGAQHLERRAGELGATGEIGAARHNLTLCQY